MAFKSVNEISAFSFEDCMITKFEYKEKEVYMELEALIVKANNSQNTNYTESYAGPTQVRLQGAKVISGYQEGSKYYDANDVLVEQVPDQPVAPLEYDSVIKKCVDAQAYLFQLEPQQVENGFSYRMFLDLEETTYMITVSFSKSIAEWERFQNKFMQ